MSLRILDLESARKTILKRRPPDEFEVTQGLLDGIERIFGERIHPEEVVRRIIADARQRGDDALLEWTERIDGVTLEEMWVGPDAIREAAEATSPDLIDALHQAAERIRAFHEMQPVTSWMHPSAEGILGQMVTPIERVGVYVPGGTAPLPSTLLMSVIPAQVAGVDSITVTTPPHADPIILAAAQVAGVDRILHLGGVMAIAALAYGSARVQPVDKIVGPGNLFVALAKKQVYGAVGIDGILGPTETLVIADDSANPALVAADMLAQAEHDVLAAAVLVTPSRAFAEAVRAAIDAQLVTLSRADIIAESLAHGSGAVLVRDLNEAFDVANAYAVEHLQLSVENPMDWLGRVRNAGAVFLGEHSFEVLGDYVAGPSHSLPTSGTARFASGLNVMDFVKLTGVIGLERAAAAELSRIAAKLAHAEQLTAHAAAAEARSDPNA